MTETNNLTTPINIELGSNGGTITFHNFEEIKEWIEKESTYWAWLGSSNNNVNELTQIWQSWTREWTSINKQTDHTISRIGLEHYDTQLAGLIQMIQTAYTKHQLLHSSTPEAAFITSLKSRINNNAAFYALAYLTNKNFSANNHNAIAGSQAAFAYQYGIKDRAESETTALINLRNEWQQKFASQAKEQQNLIDSSTKLNRDIDDELHKFKDSLTQQLNNSNELLSDYNLQKQTEIADLFNNTKHQLQSYLSESNSKLEELITTFDQKLSLQAPVTYWGKKRKYHQKQRSLLLKQITIGGAIGLISLIASGVFVLGTEAKPLPVEYFFLLLLSGVIIWSLKIGIKLYLSHTHLEADAFERITLAHSYLAFLRRGNGVEDKDRQIILDALFRHSQTGLSKDDGGNPHILLDFADRLRNN